MAAARPVLRRILPWVGRVLSVLGVIFVVLRLRDYGGQLDLASFGAAMWLLLSGLTLAFTAAKLMPAFAWWSLLRQFGGQTSCRWALETYGISQIAKYVPGNVLHLLSRQAMGAAAHVPNWTLAKSMVGELVLVAASGALFGLLALPLVKTNMALPNAAAAYAIAVGAIAFGLRYQFGPHTVRALGCYVGFFAVSGALFVFLLELVATATHGLRLLWIPMCGAYGIAWLAGFLTPGAPAGLGIREMALLFLLKGVVNEADLLLVAVLWRGITITGDVLFFGVVSLLRSRQ